MIVSLSILSAPLLDLSSTIDHMLECGVDRLHLDIMDGQYVPKIAFGLDWVHAIATQFPSLPIDVHLMTQHVTDQIYQDYTSAGAQMVWIHPDTYHPRANMTEQQAWVLSLDEQSESLPSLHQTLVMSVKPGKGGQAFCPLALDHIKDIRHRSPRGHIAVDGGVNREQIPLLARAGANEIIMGHALIHAKDPKELIALAKQKHTNLSNIQTTSDSHL